MSLFREPLKIFCRAALDIIFPPRCHFCGSWMSNGNDLHLCDECLREMRSISSPLCTACGIPFRTEGGINHLCSVCSTRHPPLTMRGALLYEGKARELIHRFKYQHKVQICRPLGLFTAELLGNFVSAASPSLIIPVPLHPRKLRERGFNQSLLLGQVLARQWRVPLCRRSLRRTRFTLPQTELSAEERAANVRGAFAVWDDAAIRGKRILLVDDVCTTGSTIRECAKVLLRSGSEEVFAVTVARAPL
ncbi:ComF family protein [Geobacter sp. DSM 9736]|uniref:ComF family protein n=1 Tax=Geobacter sp. DSM 9736 TaxID=1277350 RepID=UPI000B600396|nr:ComF family protein [Geobacter sp. DSM 9736]SNB46914.1 comF family protein [Geobacter sp. DSM 9736]